MIGLERFRIFMKRIYYRPEFEPIWISELDFYIWNANFQSLGRGKSEAKIATHGRNF